MLIKDKFRKEITDGNVIKLISKQTCAYHAYRVMYSRWVDVINLCMVVSYRSAQAANHATLASLEQGKLV